MPEARGTIARNTLVGSFFFHGDFDDCTRLIQAFSLAEIEGEHGGKHTPVHMACVVGDTVGDPFKDTSGPVSVI
jgi:Na+/H+-translocating membrane pyrophosphatase